MHLKLHRKQGYALQTAATEVLFGGAAFGGKSHLMRCAAIIWCMQIPGLQVYLFRRTLPDLKKNHMQGPSCFPVLLAELVAAGVCRINWGDLFIEFSNGSRITLAHCQHEQDMYNYQGAEFHVLLIDELTHFLQQMYRYLRGRLRMVGVKLPEKYEGMFPRILASANPGGIGHNWVRSTWIDPAPPLSIVQQTEEEGGLMRQFIPALMIDNPTGMAADPKYLSRLHGLGNKALVQAMVKGDWDIVAGGMFDDVWPVPVAPFPIPPTWRRSRSFDWGSAKPFSVCWWAQSDGTGTKDAPALPKGTWVLTAEWYGWDGHPDTGCRMLAAEIGRGILEKEKAMGLVGKVIAGPADSAIYAVQNGNCIADDMARVGVRWTPADKGPGSRINGWEKVRQLLSAAKEHPMTEPALVIFDTCRQAIRTLPVLPRDKLKADDVDTDSEDHVADAIRYRVTMGDKLAGAVEVP